MNILGNTGKKIKVFIAAIAISGVFVFSTAFVDNYFEISKNLDIFVTLFRELNLYYVDDTDPGKLMKKGIDEMLESLDPYTVYIPESEIEDHRFMITGQYGGIGAIIRKNGNDIIIAEPYEGYPAHKSGLIAGDVLIEIDDKIVKGKNTDEVSETLKGQPGTTIKIVFKREGEKKNIEKTITREEIKVNGVNYSGMLTDDVGYIKLTNFTNTVSQEIKDAFLGLKEKQGMKKLVLDLRDNPGGLLREAVNIVNLFVPKGSEVVSTKGRSKEWDKVHKALNTPVDIEIPVIVLVNRSSASASEIVSGSLQDIDRAVIIGQRTFGKGLVQQTRPLSYNAQLKVTTAKYYIPSGRCIQTLDYSHRNEDGSVGKIPDSLITEYKTKNNRSVYDGGGIIPDIRIEVKEFPVIMNNMLSKMLIFDFANKYYREHDKPEDARNFDVSDLVYEEFVDFIKQKDFEFNTGIENKLAEVKKAAEAEGRYEEIEPEYTAMSKKLEPDIEGQLEKHKLWIKKILKSEIAARYFFQKGRIEATLSEDHEVNRAIEVLNDNSFYSSILNGLTEAELTNDNKGQKK